MKQTNKYASYSETAQNFVIFFGRENQRYKAIEELSELIRAISKNDKINIIEEIGDVLFLIEQLTFIYSISYEDVFQIFDEKHNKMQDIFKPQKQKNNE